MTQLTKEAIIELLARNDKAVGRALVVLTARQTFDEKQNQDTKYQNGVGFTPADAKMGVSMGEQFLRKNYLSTGQLAYWRKPNAKGVMRIAKYWAQLIDAAKEKAAKAQDNLDLIETR